MEIKISEIQVVPVKASDGLIGFASFVFNDAFYMGGIGIYTKPYGGIRLTYPMRKHASGGINIFHPINKFIGDQVCDAVAEKYKTVIS